MPSNRTSVYWDACVFIDRIQGTPSRIDLLRELTSLAERGSLLIVTSTLTIAEELRNESEDFDPDRDLAQIRDFFEHEWISLRAVDRSIAEAAAKLRRKYGGLKVPDAVHLATAVSKEIPVMHTYDSRLLGYDGLHGTPKLKIKEPFHPESSPLFDP